MLAAFVARNPMTVRLTVLAAVHCAVAFGAPISAEQLAALDALLVALLICVKQAQARGAVAAVSFRLDPVGAEPPPLDPEGEDDVPPTLGR